MPFKLYKMQETIFLVDDDQFSLEMQKKMISEIGNFDIYLFISGQECINQLILEPKIIFLDYNMNPINGIEILKKIKRFNPSIYIVFVSGQETIKVAVDALKYGAFDYIVKGENEFQNLQRVLEKIKRIQELEKKNTIANKINNLFNAIIN